MKKLIIIKLGGSVVTDKTKAEPTPRKKVIARLAEDISEIFKSEKYRLILVHGAGSYGHPLARKYNLAREMQTEEQKFGFGLITQKMLELNALIIESLLKKNLPAVALTPHSFVKQSEGKIKSFDYQIVKDLLDSGQIPVLYGDAVLDNKWGCSILSGDTIVSYLAKKLKAKKVIFLSDVDGIYDRDPKKDKKAKLIKEINNENLEKVLEGITANNPHDVTGEMKGKILEIKEGLKGVLIQISNGLKKDAINRTLARNPGGTVLQFE